MVSQNNPIFIPHQPTIMSTGGGNKGSPSSNPNSNPPNTQRSPSRHHSGVGGGQNPLASSPQRPRPMSALLRQRSSPTSPHQSAFTPVGRPQQPFPQFPPPQGPIGSGSGYVYRGPFGFYNQGVPAPALVPVGGSGSGSAGGGGVRIGGPANPAAKKRGRDAAASSGGGGAGDGALDNRKNCSICQKSFASEKALFGHMRSHPCRGWKGAHPPPTFNAEEEFAAVPGVNLPGAVAEPDAVEEEAGGVEGGDGMAAGGREAAVEQRAAEEAAVAAAEQRRGFRIDLNDMAPDAPAAPDA